MTKSKLNSAVFPSATCWTRGADVDGIMKSGLSPGKAAAQGKGYLAPRRTRADAARTLIGNGMAMAEGARREPGWRKVLARLIRCALFRGLARTYPFSPALPALSPRD